MPDVDNGDVQLIGSIVLRSMIVDGYSPEPMDWREGLYVMEVKSLQVWDYFRSPQSLGLSQDLHFTRLLI
jgi:hypothetical protein